MKVSDIILIVAGAAGAYGAYLSYQNYSNYAGDPFGDPPARVRYTDKTPLVPVRDAREKKEGSLESLLDEKEDDLQGINGEIAKLNEENKNLTAEIDQMTKEKIDIDADVQRYDREIAKNEAKLAELGRYLQKFGDPDQIREKVKGLKDSLNSTQQSLAAAKDSLASNIARHEQLERSIGGHRETIEMAQTGRMSPSFSSSVREVYGRWGFVVIQGGVDQGVNAKTTLDVIRGGQRIAKLVVTTVEPSLSVCSIVESSVIGGMQVMPGDTVKPSAEPENSDGASSGVTALLDM